jgi:hypothetical protein
MGGRQFLAVHSNLVSLANRSITVNAHRAWLYLVDAAHAHAAQLLDDAVVRNGLADQEEGSVHSSERRDCMTKDCEFCAAPIKRRDLLPFGIEEAGLYVLVGISHLNRQLSVSRFHSSCSSPQTSIAFGLRLLWRLPCTRR